MGKKGQLAIFIIIALVIVALVLVLLLYNRVNVLVSPEPVSRILPEQYISDCMKEEMAANIASLSRQGGYSNPEGYLEYQGDKVKYLCYTAEYYTTCVVQQPMIKEQYEKELSKAILPKAKECLNSFKEEYTRKGYTVSAKTPEVKMRIEPSQIVIRYDLPMTISKDTTRTFEGFDVKIKSEMYELLMISQSIVDYESNLGDSDINDFISYYADLSIQKTRLGDGSKVYTVKNFVTNESFRFASRSLAWPAGYPE